jgi:hypothetical protein
MATPTTDMQTVDEASVAVFTPTPEQATYLAKLAEAGTEKAAIEAAGIDRRMLRTWGKDEAFVAAVKDAERDFTDQLVGKLGDAVVNASDEDVLNHPNAAFFLVKARDHRYRDNTTVTIDNRQQTVNVLTPEQSEAIARALAGIPDGEPVP